MQEPLKGWKTYLIGVLTFVWGASFAFKDDPKYGVVLMAVAALAMALRKAVANLE